MRVVEIRFEPLAYFHKIGLQADRDGLKIVGDCDVRLLGALLSGNKGEKGNKGKELTSRREQTKPPACPEGQAGRDESASVERHDPSVSRDGSSSGGDTPEVVRMVSHAQKGDRDAFEWLILEYQDRVWRRALYRLRDHDEAYDLAQEVFLICFRKIGQFRGESKFWTWLSRIVDNLVKNRQAWLIRRGSNKTVSLDAPMNPEESEQTWDAPDPSPGPRHKAENREAMSALDQNLDRISPDHREVLLLRFADGLAYEEIAETLQLSIGTVKSRINRARAELRELMTEHLE